MLQRFNLMLKGKRHFNATCDHGSYGNHENQGCIKKKRKNISKEEGEE